MGEVGGVADEAQHHRQLGSVLHPRDVRRGELGRLPAENTVSPATVSHDGDTGLEVSRDQLPAVPDPVIGIGGELVGIVEDRGGGVEIQPLELPPAPHDGTNGRDGGVVSRHHQRAGEPAGIAQVGRALVVHGLGHHGFRLVGVLHRETTEAEIRQPVIAVQAGVGLVGQILGNAPARDVVDVPQEHNVRRRIGPRVVGILQPGLDGEVGRPDLAGQGDRGGKALALFPGGERRCGGGILRRRNDDIAPARASPCLGRGGG
jgi:hypothetical protein